MELDTLTIHEAGQLLAEGKISSVELTQAFLERIEAHDQKIGAFITVDSDLALAQARKADERIAAGNGTAFTGIPIALKDLLCTKGVRTTCSSKILENFIPNTMPLWWRNSRPRMRCSSAKPIWTSLPWGLQRKTPRCS